MWQGKQLYSGQSTRVSIWQNYHFCYVRNTAHTNSILEDYYLKLFYTWSKFCTVQFKRQENLLLNHYVYLHAIPQTSVTDYGPDCWKSPCNSKEFSLQVNLQIDPVGQPASYPTSTVFIRRGVSSQRARCPDWSYLLTYTSLDVFIAIIVTTFTCLIQALF